MHRMLPILALPEFLLRQKWLRWALRRCIDGVMFLRPVDAFVEKLFGIVVILGKPTSRGSVRLTSKNPQDAALIDPAWFQSPHDKQLMEQGIESVSLNPDSVLDTWFFLAEEKTKQV